jgi:hypothetical protein
MKASTKLSKQQQQQMLELLKQRFEKNMHRHKNIQWNTIEKKLLQQPHKIYSLQQMDNTGGEPDVVEYNTTNDEYMFIDCSKETPTGRRSICYDKEALLERKEFKPSNSAMELATSMGVTITTEQEYRALQAVETVDTKTSSWLLTPAAIRKLGGAIFADYRYGTVFIYHNGAQSYYAGRGFRSVLYV